MNPLSDPQLHYEFTVFFAIRLWIHYLFANLLWIDYEFTVNILIRLWIYYRFDEIIINSSWFTQIYFDFTILPANSLLINHLFANSLWAYFLFRDSTMKSLSISSLALSSLSISRIDYELTIRDLTTIIFFANLQLTLLFEIWLWLHYQFSDLTMSSLFI